MLRQNWHVQQKWQTSKGEARFSVLSPKPHGDDMQRRQSIVENGRRLLELHWLSLRQTLRADSAMWQQACRLSAIHMYLHADAASKAPDFRHLTMVKPSAPAAERAPRTLNACIALYVPSHKLPLPSSSSSEKSYFTRLRELMSYVQMPP